MFGEFVAEVAFPMRDLWEVLAVCASVGSTLCSSASVDYLKGLDILKRRESSTAATAISCI